MTHHLGETMTTADVARLWGVSPRTVQRAVNKGLITPVAQAPGVNGAFMFSATAAHTIGRRYYYATKDPR